VKIAYLLASSMISGGGKVILQQAEELGRRGHTVTVIGPEEAPTWFPLRRARYERSSFGRAAALREAEVVVAGFFTTIEPALACASGLVFHLCQGVESDTTWYASRKEEIEAAYRRVPRKLVVSPHLKTLLQNRGFEGVEDIGQTFEAQEFRVGERAFTRRPLRILLPGIFPIDSKGVPESLEALAALRREGGEFRLVRVSAEPVSPEERAMKVVDEYHTRVPPSRMPGLLAFADIFLGPNHAIEGFDLPALEALASGLPAALSDTPAHRNTAGDSAVFFAPQDAAGIRKAVGRLLAEESTRRRLSEEGPARAARFRTQDVGDRLEEIFQNALTRA
jgi:glycosyltransferase involved in cell wall biosynthesis